MTPKSFTATLNAKNEPQVASKWHQSGSVATHFGPLGREGAPKSSKKDPGTKSRGAGKHRGGTEEAPRRHRGGTEEAPRRHQGGTREAPRRHLGIVMGPRALKKRR